MHSHTLPATYSVDEVAQKLGIGRNSCYAAVRRGQIPSIKIGKRLLVSRVVLERILEQGTNPEAKSLVG